MNPRSCAGLVRFDCASLPYQCYFADAVNQIRSGRAVPTGMLATSIVERYVGNDLEISADAPIDGLPLTDREVEIVKLLAHGRGNKAMALALSLSTRTIESDRHGTMRKMSLLP